MDSICVATLALGSRPRQGVVRLRAKRKEARESKQKAKVLEGCGPRGSLGVITYSRESKEVRGSVREWELTLPRQLPFWERESRWTSETSEGKLKAQIPMDCCILYTVGKILERRCLKWARIAHLDIWNASYGQKKGRESNWQFDSRPLKVGNRPLLDIRFESATRRWKALNEGYNFASDCVVIGLCSRDIWASKVPGLQPRTVSGLPLGSPGKNSHLDVVSAASCRVYYKGEKGGRWWLPPSPGCGESCVSVLPVARPSTKGAPTMH
jgi:hypothetical protein